MSDNTDDTARRFEIFVPSPKARINLGAPNTTATGPFGYTGLSLQSDVHLFIDANKHTLFQTGQNYCGQVGGKWLQYSNADMIMSSTASVNLSADKKVLLAAGSGQGQVTALDHGTFPRVVPYNALALAYRLDRIQTGLFEFFHGRRERSDYGPKMKIFLSTFGNDDTGYFDADDASGTELQTEAELQGGFLARTSASLRELYPVAATRELTEYSKDSATEPDPIVLLDPLIMKKVVGGSTEAKDLRYGFTPYFNRFDPYALINVSKLEGGLIIKGLATFRNGLAWMRRFADVCTKYAYLITDNKLGERAQKLMGAVDNLAKATWAAYHVVGPFLEMFEGLADGWQVKGFAAKFVDEKDSGVGARAGGSNPVEDAQAAKDAKKDQQAKIQSARGPFDLSSKTSWTMTVEWDGGGTGKSADVTLSSAPTPATAATLNVQAGAFAGTEAKLDIAPTPFAAGDTGTLTLTVDGTPYPMSFDEANGSTVAAIASHIRTALSAAPYAVTEASGTITIKSSSIGAAHTIAVTAASATDDEAAPVERFNLAPGTTAAGTDAVTGSVVFRIDALYTVAVALAPSNASTAALLSTALSNALGPSGCTVAGAGPITITTTRTGPTASIEILGQVGSDTTSAAAAGLLGHSVGDSAFGAPEQPGLDLSSVSGADVVGRISANGVSASDPAGTVQITSKKKGGGSEVKVSGALADKLWDKNSKNEKISAISSGGYAQGRGSSEAFYKTLISWNHELQKLPEDTRNLTRPIRDAVNDVVASATALEQAAEGIADLVGKADGLPSPPEAIGLIADEGITLGTRDRIVGAGGKGIVFIADGGSGAEDHNRFVPKVEQFVNLSMLVDPIAAAVKGIKYLFGKAEEEDEPAAPEPPPSLGFRVLSDSTVDLMGTNSAQLMALGRGKLFSAGPDGESLVGTGIARIAGSYAAEVAGYRKVVISARSAGDKDKTGGRVEVAGQTIAIGGMNLAGDTKDFDSTKDALFGIAPLVVDNFAGSEHLSEAHKEGLKTEFLAHAWPTTLRDGGDAGHADTQRVFVHAAKETVIQVGAFYVHVDGIKGVTVGTRTADPDPTANVIDATKPSIQITPDGVLVSMGEKDKDSTLDLSKDSVLLYEGPTKNNAARSQLELEAGVATLYGGNSFFEAKQGKLSLYADNLDTSKTKNIKLTASGTIKIG